MALPIASVAIEMPDSEPHPATTRDLINGFREYERLFQAIAAYPPAAICERFEEDAALCESWLASEVHRCREKVKRFLREAGDGQADVSKPEPEPEEDEKLRLGLAKVMKEFVDYVLLHGTMFEHRRKMSQAAAPSPVAMDFYRSHLNDYKGNHRAPNGQDISMYGFQGDPVPPAYATAYNEELSPIQSFLAFKLMEPFIEHIRRPLRRFWGNLTGKNEADLTAKLTAKDRVIDMDHIAAFAKIVACMLPTASLAVATTVLNSLGHSSGLRIAVMTMLGLAFSTSVYFFGVDSMPMYQLVTAYFQAMVFFVGTNFDQNTCR